MILHGFPAATTLAGMSLLTKLHAPTIELSPICTPARSVVLQPIKQFFPIIIGPK